MPGQRLKGSVTTRDGRSLVGRLVYDLDESETTETLDASLGGVNYTIPFGLISLLTSENREEHGSKFAQVTLFSGERLQLERTGDLGDGNAGILIFVDESNRPEYVPWPDVIQVEFSRPQAMFPPVDRR
ncbi:hypothetical protein HQ496_07670 [bacterium]|nr:hypothetical protein [bacterium]